MRPQSESPQQNHTVGMERQKISSYYNTKMKNKRARLSEQLQMDPNLTLELEYVKRQLLANSKRF